MSKGSDEFEGADDHDYRELADLNDDESRRTSGVDRLRPSFVDDEEDSAAPSQRALLNGTPLLGASKKKKKSVQASKCGF